MRKDNIDQVLEALLNSASEKSGPAVSPTHGGTEVADLPNVDERAELFLRAIYGTESEFTAEERENARYRIIDSMAFSIVAEIETRNKQHFKNEVGASEELQPSPTIIPFRSKVSPTAKPPEPLRLAARSNLKSVGATDQEVHRPSEKRSQMELVGPVIIDSEETEFHRQERKVFIELPVGRIASQLHLGSEHYSLSAPDSTRRYLVNELRPGVAKRFVLDQAEDPTGYPAWLS